MMMLPSMVDILPGGCASFLTPPHFRCWLLHGIEPPPCRHETGEFFALDLGGTNFRVLYVKLSDDHGGVVSHPWLPQRTAWRACA